MKRSHQVLRLPARTLVAGFAVMAMLLVLQAPVRVANADTPEGVPGAMVLHKHCLPFDATGTFFFNVDFEFDPDDIAEEPPVDEDTAFDQLNIPLSCGDGLSTTADGNTVVLDLSALIEWLGEFGDQVRGASFLITEGDPPAGVSVGTGDCDAEGVQQLIDEGWVCTFLNIFDEDEDDDDDGGIDIDNVNVNVITIENINTNDNANDNENENENENENDNANDNTNTNTQNQTNEQNQSNENTQINN